MTQAATQFVLPWDLLVTVIIVSIVCAILSTAMPVTNLVVRQSIVSVLRA
jgi:hypothetical protein